MAHNEAGTFVQAWHPLYTDPEFGSQDHLWPDFEVGGDQEITYTSCGGPFPEVWHQGLDQWRNVLPNNWNFVGFLSICDPIQTQLRYESAADGFCPPPDIPPPPQPATYFLACWRRLSSQPHSDHTDLIRARILFDADNPPPYNYNSLSGDWQIAVAAHEWGHNLGLAHHLGTNCDDESLAGPDAGSLMAKAELGSPPCNQGPNAADLSSVMCVYRTCDTPGVFRSDVFQFLLRKSNANGNADLTNSFGTPTDVPLVGDWNGDGVDTCGLYRPSTRQFFLSDPNCAAPSVYTFGNPGDIPLVGDWNANGIDSIGVYRPSTAQFFLSNLNQYCDWICVQFGNAGDQPLVGDWDGGGFDTIGVYRPSTREFHLTDNFVTVPYSFTYGDPGDIPLTGNWDGNGKDSVGVRRGTVSHLRNALSAGAADISFNYGLSTDKPIPGDWRAR